MSFTTRTARRLIMGAAMAGLAIGAPAIALASTSAPARPAAVSQTPACETPSLVIWLTSNGAGAGSSFYTLNFTNLSGHSCTLNGYPFVHAVNLKGKPIGRRARFNPPAPHQITIRNGHTATAALQLVDALNFPKSACGPTQAAGFEVFPPNQTTAKTVPLPFEACSKQGENFMSVDAVK